MARAFDGVDDDLVTATGALSGMTFGTVAACFKLSSTANFPTLFTLVNSGGSPSVGLYVDAALLSLYNGVTISAGPAVNATDWYVVVARKATGSAIVRFSLFNVTSGAWAHSSGGAVGNWASPGAGGTVRLMYATGADCWNGNVAVRAAWANTLPWSADATGDALLEAAGLPWSLLAWINASPSALWVLDQSETIQNVPDLTGGGANQSSITGTTVSSESVPGLGYGDGAWGIHSTPSSGLPPPVEGPANSSTMTGQRR